jgi:hypothetical protein
MLVVVVEPVCPGRAIRKLGKTFRLPRVTEQRREIDDATRDFAGGCRRCDFDAGFEPGFGLPQEEVRHTVRGTRTGLRAGLRACPLPAATAALPPAGVRAGLCEAEEGLRPESVRLPEEEVALCPRADVCASTRPVRSTDGGLCGASGCGHTAGDGRASDARQDGACGPALKDGSSHHDTPAGLSMAQAGFSFARLAGD